MILFRFSFVFIFVIVGVVNGMTRQQVKKTLGLMKNKCLSTSGATEDKVDKIEQGTFIEEKSVMCYIACIYKSIQVVKNNKLDGDAISKQIDLLYPQELKEPVKQGVAKCMPIQNSYNDMCEGIFYATKCLYEHDPKTFIFP